MRRWLPYLVLAPSTVDLEAAERPEATGGAVACVRDVLAGPPAWFDEDGREHRPTKWLTGTVSPTPALAAATTALFGRGRPGVDCRLGARVYYAEVPRTTAGIVAAVPSIVAGVAKAVDPEDGWPAPRRIVVLRAEAVTVTAALSAAYPDIGVVYVPTVSPESMAGALRGLE